MSTAISAVRIICFCLEKDLRKKIYCSLGTKKTPQNCSVKVLSAAFKIKKKKKKATCEKTNCEPGCFIKAEASREDDSPANPGLKLSGSLKPQRKNKSNGEAVQNSTVTQKGLLQPRVEPPPWR